jgi:hypothetical protein
MPRPGAIPATLSGRADLNSVATESAPTEREPAESVPCESAATQIAADATDSSRKQVLAAASPGLAALLNLVPGLGTGYIYQRRWRAYWICSALATAWFLAGALLAPQSASPTEQQQLVGLAGLLLLAGVTAADAFLAGRRARMD